MFFFRSAFLVSLAACETETVSFSSDDPNQDWDGDGQTENAGDCNDNNASVYSGAEEICDGIDNDCDEIEDENTCDEDTGG
jgi:hypothetical protein